MFDADTILADCLPFWKELSLPERDGLAAAVHGQSFPKGTLMHRGAGDCVGLFLVTGGQLRVYTMSDEGKELTLYRLFERDLCLFSAACMLNGIQFDIFVSAEEDTDTLIIPPPAYEKLMNGSLAVSKFTNRLMASRFSEIMWLLDQVQNKKLDSRLAALLLEESGLRGSDTLTVTHEQLANHLGTMREVVSRMLKYFSGEELVTLGRGSVVLTDREGLEALAADSIR